MSMANVLAGDVGGTSTRLGIFERAPRPAPVVVRTYGTRDFASIETMTAAFLRDVGVPASSVTAACFGAAGPVINGVATLTNTPVRVDAHAIADVLGLARLSLLNDLEALAHFVERHRRRGPDLARRQPHRAELRRQRHREASRVCRGNQLLRIRAFSVLESRAEGILRVRQDAAVGRHSPFAILQPTSPHC